MGDDNKSTFASVTDVPCTCGYLQEAADDPANPIVFDKDTHEFQFKYYVPHYDFGENCRGMMLVIYHCPFCAGAAPRSKRELLFARIPPDEEARLAGLLASVQTVDDAANSLGTPDFDDYCITRQSEHGDRPSTTAYYREIRYYSLSQIADVCNTERADGTIRWQLQGKLIKKEQDSA